MVFHLACFFSLPALANHSTKVVTVTLVLCRQMSAFTLDTEDEERERERKNPQFADELLSDNNCSFPCSTVRKTKYKCATEHRRVSRGRVKLLRDFILISTGSQSRKRKRVLLMTTLVVSTKPGQKDDSRLGRGGKRERETSGTFVLSYPLCLASLALNPAKKKKTKWQKDKGKITRPISCLVSQSLGDFFSLLFSFLPSHYVTKHEFSLSLSLSRLLYYGQREREIDQCQKEACLREQLLVTKASQV